MDLYIGSPTTRNSTKRKIPTETPPELIEVMEMVRRVHPLADT
jgi:hypothetical protein